MKTEDSHNFVFHDEFLRINKAFEAQLDVRCMDLHSIQLALINLPGMEQVKVPSIYISYFLKKTSAEFQNEFASYTKANIESMLHRVNNYFAQNIFHSAEEHLIEGLILLRTIQSLTTITVPSKTFREHLELEKSKNRMFGTLETEIKALIAKSGGDIIPQDCPYYSYLKNYVTLRNCFTHRNGKITEKEKDLEIRLPYISEEQIETAKKSISSDPITPQTIIRKWELNDTVRLTLQEVEGIALGLQKTLFQIFKHMYKAADKHVENLMFKKGK
jgi:hypothetical protein